MHDARLALQRLRDLFRALPGRADGAGGSGASGVSGVSGGAAPIDAYVVPSGDPHQSEYVPECWQRRAFLCGFDGSAGDLVVTRDAAMLWTDGRYWLQAERQLRASGVALMRAGAEGVPTWQEWLASLPRGSRVGVDPRTLACRTHDDLRKSLGAKGLTLVDIDANLVDLVWEGRPAAPASALRVHPSRIAGRAAADKLADLRRAMRAKGADAHPISALDSIAWLFNLRGADVLCNPVFVAYALITPESATLYTDAKRVGAEAKRSLEVVAALAPYEAFESDVRALARKGARWWFDEAGTSAWVESLLGEPSTVAERGRSPIVQAKAVKNASELEGMRAAHVRDGVALVKFLHWLEGAVPKGGITEVSAAERLDAFRAEGEGFLGPSFPSISSSGPNGAVIHYRPSPETNLPVTAHEVYLIDSGGQYEDGTTDVTRTLHLGRPTAEERDRCTRVLRGHIALATRRFPKGARGAQLDSFARAALWDAGLEYGHGTGHGVGAALCVHEWPPNVSAKPAGQAMLEPGMIFSNEPGFYADGRFGCRYENLEVVVEDAAPGFLRLESLTLAPFHAALLDASALRADEIAWLNAYHARVRDALTPLLDAERGAWLARATAPI